MKKLFIAIVLTIATFGVKAKNPFQNNPDSCSKMFLGFSGGINNCAGLIGICAEVNAMPKVFLKFGAGIGSWGTKITGGLRIGKECTKGWSWGISYSYCSGLVDFKTTDNGNDVTMDLEPASALNFTATHTWLVGRKNHIFLDLGYSILAEEGSINVKKGYLSDNGKKAISAIQPGGLILGVGFLFGL